jgi:hypothetical protein
LRPSKQELAYLAKQYRSSDRRDVYFKELQSRLDDWLSRFYTHKGNGLSDMLKVMRDIESKGLTYEKDELAVTRGKVDDYILSILVK